MPTVSTVPEGYSSVTAHLNIKNAAAAIEFYKKAFGAIERSRLADPETGFIGHAELLIGNSMIMLADECPMGSSMAISPAHLPGPGVSIHLYVDNVDAVVAQAAFCGAQVLYSPVNQFYGDRNGVVRDPFGHIWNIATRVENISPEEMQKRAAEWMKTMATAQ